VEDTAGDAGPTEPERDLGGTEEGGGEVELT
jgi:hypothetical protein